jgi:plastocyanin
MNTKPLLIVLAVIVLLIVAYFVFAGGASAPTETATTTVTGAPATDGTGAPVVTTTTTTTSTNVTITYGPNGFSPTNVTVAPGTTVTWVNQGSGRMWVASDEHPTHTEFDNTALNQHCANGAPISGSVFDQCNAGSSFSFTFTKAGTWEYHNHAQASDHGTVTVR